jgi:hypothetical protein
LIGLGFSAGIPIVLWLLLIALGTVFGIVTWL